MCLEFLRKVGAQLFVKHRKNYQENLEIGGYFLYSKAMLYKCLNYINRTGTQYVSL